MARRQGLTLPSFPSRASFLWLAGFLRSWRGLLVWPARVLPVLVLSVLVLAGLPFLAPAAFADDPTTVPTAAPTTPEPTSQAPTPPPVTQAPRTVVPTEPPPPPPTPAQQTETAPDEPGVPYEPPAPEPATTDQPTIIISPDTSGDSTPIWPWVLGGLGALLLIGAIVLIARALSRHNDTAAAWRTRRLNAYAEGAALHDAILAAISGQNQPPGEVQLAEIRRRANDFNQRLYQLRETAPDQESQLDVEQVLSSLQALRSAMDTERGYGAIHGMTADITRERLNDFRVSLYTLRDPE